MTHIAFAFPCPLSKLSLYKPGFIEGCFRSVEHGGDAILPPVGVRWFVFQQMPPRLDRLYILYYADCIYVSLFCVSLFWVCAETQRYFSFTSTDYWLHLLSFCFVSLCDRFLTLHNYKGEKKHTTHVGVLCLFVVAVLASFRGTVQHGLPLEIGDTVQILEKCEGTMHTWYTLIFETEQYVQWKQLIMLE